MSLQKTVWVMKFQEWVQHIELYTTSCDHWENEARHLRRKPRETDEHYALRKTEAGQSLKAVRRQRDDYRRRFIDWVQANPYPADNDGG